MTITEWMVVFSATRAIRANGQMGKQVLLVAPTTSPPLPEAGKEVQSVNNSLQAAGYAVILLQGQQATRDNLLREVRRPFDLVWFATHSDNNGIQLSDGYLDTSSIVQFMRGHAPDVYLNTCDSIHIAQALQREVGGAVICTIKPVMDDKAYQTASLMAHWLAEGRSLRDAFETARPGADGVYVFLAGREDENDIEVVEQDDSDKIRADIQWGGSSFQLQMDKKEPVLIWGVLGMLVGALLREFVPDISDELLSAVVDFIVVGGPILAGLLIARSRVFSPATVERDYVQVTGGDE